MAVRTGDRHKPRKGDRHKPRKRPYKPRSKKRVYKKPAVKVRPMFIGIDGEGQGRAPHRYTFLAASDVTGEKTWCVRNPEGLSTIECLDFIVSLPSARTKVFAYSFGYDLTKILTDVDDRTLYLLFRPDLRPGEHGPKPLFWPIDKPAYSLNLLGTRFTVKKILAVRTGVGSKYKGRARYSSSHVIHDIWKFFQGKFTAALEDWEIATLEARAHMALMKGKRAEFDKVLAAEVERYCFEECRYMAELAGKLTDAAEAVDLELKSYFGAGSLATPMLTKMGFKEHIAESRLGRVRPAELDYAIACAFHAGRFEHSRIGRVEGPVYSYDISSAYPYQTCFLPCLIHGSWRKTAKFSEARKAKTALIRYELPEVDGWTREEPWGPFPFRLKDGTIVYPRVSGGGWLWRDEYFAGAAIFPTVFKEAWVYETTCTCNPGRGIATFYRERIRVGKESGPGRCIKTAIASCYGKMAQTLGGQGPFSSWILAGLITSGCRAQVLHAMALHKDLRSLLMVATDGICTLERLTLLPKPRDTGTSDLDKPLGGWEEKILPQGLFLARPGIYFANNPTAEDLKSVRGRGIGRAAILEHWKKIVDAYERGDEKIRITDLGRDDEGRIRELVRFVGAKTAISKSAARDETGEAIPGKFVYKRSPTYGEWISRPVEMTFNPLPKRELGSGNVLALRSFPGETSWPYKAAIVSPEAAELKALTQEQAEQADGGDLVEHVRS